MNMSEDIAGVTMQMNLRSAEAAANVSIKSAEIIAKLLKYLFDEQKKKATDITNIAPGKTSIEKLVASAKQTGDSVSVTENGFTKSDMKILQKKAKEYGIPISFINKDDKDNIYVAVRTNDIPIFKRMCTEMMKEKVAQRPQELGNFKVQDWEIPYITQELKKYDLSAQFGRTKDGESFCLYEKADEKAILIARGEFFKKCKELQNDFKVTKDDYGFYTIENSYDNVKRFSFDDEGLTYVQVSKQFQQKFGYDENKADIAAAKFGEENLTGKQKQKFFAKSPQDEFDKIDTNIQVKGENILAKDFNCLRLIPKDDSVQKIVFRDNKGNFALLNPAVQTTGQMTKMLKESLGITDTDVLQALTDKAQKVSDFYNQQAKTLFSYNQAISENEKISGRIERVNQNSFKVFVNGSEDYKTFSFSDKKASVITLKEDFMTQGASEPVAKKLAKEIFEKAYAQSAEKVVQIEQIRSKPNHYYMDVSCGLQEETIDVDFSNPSETKKELSEKFGISYESAGNVVERAAQEITDKQCAKLKEFGFQNVENWKSGEADEMLKTIANNNWVVPTDINPQSFVPHSLMPDVPDMPHIPNPISRGGR